jgi:hypothetical protein
MIHRASRSLPFLALLSLFLGCNSGPAKVTISGKVTKKNGQPLIVDEKTMVTLMFRGQSANELQTPAVVRFDGKTGNYTAEMIPGSYQVTTLVTGAALDPRKGAPPPPAAKKIVEIKANQTLNLEVP